VIDPRAAYSAFRIPHSALVVNGDDFGYSAAINAAIVRCHVEGVLTSASVLVNQRATREALRLAREYPTLGVGWHVNLTEGGPVLPPGEVPTLVDRRGLFRPIGALLPRLLAGKVRMADVERELRAQLELLLDAGLRPTHVDGHLHAHAFPRVLPVVLGLMAEHGIGAMRSPLVGAWLPKRRAGDPAESPWGALRPGSRTLRLATAPSAIALLARLSPRAEWARAELLRRRGVVCTGRLFDTAGFLAAPDPVGAVVGAVAASPGGSVEMMSHPAWNRDAARGAAEVALLTNPCLRAALDEAGVRRVHYQQLVHGD
jgi:predicted glycoside hydrolase/deacetylase ChbG (UPF0249 family)